ncbi:MAG: hemolysin family protein, partial [Candidatus Aminicenantes bacterium]
TAFIASSPYRLDHLANKGSRRAKQVYNLLGRVDRLLATILIGNTLVNTAAASVATFIFVSFMEDKNQAVLWATVVTTLLILFFSEMTPKTYAAHNAVRLSLLFVLPLRFFLVLFYPFVTALTLLIGFVFPSQKKKPGLSRTISEEEMKALLSLGVKGMSPRRKMMISGILDIGSRPVREIMVPRPQVKAIAIDAPRDQVLEFIQSAEFSRFPVFRGRLDNIEGSIHTKDILPFLVDRREIELGKILRTPLFIPETASIEKVFLQMQEAAQHLAFVVDEFGNMEGIVTMEDIIEEIVGEIQDEYDRELEDLILMVGESEYIVKGQTPVKDVNQRLFLDIPEKGEYTTIAGFFLSVFGKIPKKGDSLDYGEWRFVVEKMNRRHISLLRFILKKQEGSGDQ